MSDSDFSSFDDALKKLELEEEDLKRLISAGEIRAFREGSNMRLRVEDVDKVADQLGLGAVGEEDAGEVLEVEDLSLDDFGEDAGMATTQLSEEDTLLDDNVEELEVAKEAPAARTSSAAPRRTSGRAAAAVAAPEAADEGNGLRFAMIATTLILILAVPFAIGMLSGQTTGITQAIVDMVSGS